MIKARELRLGNMTEQGIILHLTQFSTSVKSDQRQLRFDYRDLSPIPITEEILLKCGFMKVYPDDNYAVSKDNYLFKIGIREPIFGFLAFNNHPLPGCELKHLHQLQNLYFALTGEELNTDKL